MPGNGRGRPSGKGGPDQQNTATNGTAILPDAGDRMARRRVRTRLADEHRRLGHARLAHAAMPLPLHYRRPRGLPYCRVVEGWAA